MPKGYSNIDGRNLGNPKMPWEGLTFAGKNHTEETKQRIREAALGHKASAKSRKKMSDSKKGIYDGTKNPMFGKHHTEEVRQKLSEAQLGVAEKPFSKQRCQRLSEASLGSNHWNWQGGISFEPYPSKFNNRLKEYIRERDSYICQECGVPQSEYIYAVSPHHIDYDKMNCVETNLISLCQSCHSKTNYDRGYWQNRFEGMIAKIYTQKEVMRSNA